MSIELNGFDIEPLVEDAGMAHDDVDNFARSESTRFEGAVFEPKRKWTFNLSPTATDQEVRAHRNWIKGRHWSWAFSRVDGATTRFNQYEDGGGPRWVATSGSVSASTPTRFNTWSMRVSSGGAAAVTVQFPSPQTPHYSWGVWKLNTSGTYQFCVNTYDGSTARYFVDAYTGLTTAFAWAAVTTASGYFSVSLEGQNESGVNSSAANYDAAYIFPYTLTTPQISALCARTSMTPPRPFVEMDGGLLEEPYPIVVKGFVESEPIEEIRKNGQNAHGRWFRISLVER